MITFAIPTYNRAEKLRGCLDSICAQISGRNGFYVTVCNNKSTDSTTELLTEYSQRYSFLSFKTLPEHVMIQDRRGSWVGSVEMVQTEWVWTFGDDDVLLESGLDTVISALNDNPDLKFLHAAQVSRSANTKKIYKKDSLLELCKNFGWIDTCGFISSNVVKTRDLKTAYQSYDNKEYNKGVFPQPCVILEHLATSPAALLDYPIVGLQDTDMTEETKKRWLKEDHGTRYFYTSDAIKEIMRRQPAVPPKLPPTFFRYHTYHLWERHIDDILLYYHTNKASVPAQALELTRGYAELVNDPVMQKNILGTVLNLQDALGMIESCKAMMDTAEARLEVIKTINGSPVFGWPDILVGSQNSIEEGK